jgi:transcriptional regulator with XRE-family HTH domain
MAGHNNGNPVTHFGRQVKKERLARGWSLRELSARSGISYAHLNRIENGHRPPTEAVADAMDRVFPERKRWFREFYEDSKSSIPPSWRSFAEFEERAASLRDWYPGIVTGQLQTSAYARALLQTFPGVTDEVVEARLKGRMERQRRVLFRDDPPTAWFLVDEMALYRCVGSPEIMAEQCGHLLQVSGRPNITLQVHPAVAHPCNASGFVIADTAGYTEHVKAGYVYEDESVTPLPALFDTLRGECLKVSETKTLLERMIGTWNRLGVRARTVTPTGDSASK